MNNNRLGYIDILKGIGILFVIFSHSGAEGWFMTHFGDFFVPLFFIASGFTYTYREQPFISVFLKRARRLLVPYLFFSVILLFLYKRFSVIDFLGIFYSRYCLYPYQCEDNVFLMGGGNPPLWFLTSMLTAFVPFWLLLRYPKRVYILLTTYAIYTFACTFLPILLPWSLDTACLTGSFLYIGYLIRQYASVLLKKHVVGDVLILLTFVLACFLNGSDNLSVREYGHSFIAYIVNCVLGTLFLLRLSKRLEKTVFCGVLVKLGQHSLVIFCIQMFLLRICHMAFHNIMHFPTGGWIFYGITLVKVLIVAISGMILSKFLNKYIPWVFK